jgi:two-component system chemotaxis response regulator CheY
MFPANTKILIVDDMMTMRSAIKGQLRQMGFTTFFDAENGEKALTVLNEQHTKNEPVELVLSDWNMPVCSGLDLLKKVRASANYPNVPFLMITAEGEVAQVKEAIESGVSNYIKKPFTPSTLQEKILAVWKKHNPG